MKSMTKTKEDFNNKLLTVFNLLSIQGKYNIVGSASQKGILYASDIDLNEIDNINQHAFEKVYDIFVNKFKIAKSNPNIFITDFKLGQDQNNEPMRWSYEKLLKQKELFIKCLHTKSMIKLDLIFLLNGIFIEITEVYFLQLDHFKTYDDSELTRKDILDDLKKSYNECIKEGQFFKALKRLNSIYNIEHKSTEKLLAFFNSDSGLLYKANADLQILLTLINNNFRKPKTEDIKNNLQIIKQNLSVQTETKQNVSKIIDDICKLKNMKKIYVYIDKLCVYLAKLFNRDASRELRLRTR